MHGTGAVVPARRTRLAAFVAVWLGLLAFNRAVRRVAGGSMRPALHPGDVILVLPARRRGLRRGDVVVVRDPRNPARETVKRVVGLPGERVTVRGDTLVVAGIPHDEPYVHNRRGLARSRPSGSWMVPPSCVFVLGDDRECSTDSRTYGPLPRELVVGRVAVGLWPPRSPPHVVPRPSES
ncbi:MAG: signal peptidase I [Nitriliruptorales bacterium]